MGSHDVHKKAFKIDRKYLVLTVQNFGSVSFLTGGLKDQPVRSDPNATPFSSHISKGLQKRTCWGRAAVGLR